MSLVLFILDRSSNLLFGLKKRFLIFTRLFKLEFCHLQIDTELLHKNLSVFVYWILGEKNIWERNNIHTELWYIYLLFVHPAYIKHIFVPGTKPFWKYNQSRCTKISACIMLPVYDRRLAILQIITIEGGVFFRNYIQSAKGTHKIINTRL